MSEAELPLFPLPIVLFPGTPQPLHIFEPRYRQLVEDCLQGDRRFGLSLTKPDAGGSDAPQPGDVGCSTIIKSHYTRPDGRSNLLTIGENRYVFKELVMGDRLYHVGLVEFFFDVPASAPDVHEIAIRVRKLFFQLSKMLHDALKGAGDRLDLPTDPEQLSYHVAALLDLDLDTKESLLRLTSTRTRLQRLHLELKTALVTAARRNSVQRLAKRNGKSRNIPATK